MFIGYFDGATNPNPGKIGLGACIIGPDGNELDCAYGFREHGTNNEAEYLSLILLLKRAIKRNIKQIQCVGDSLLIINQVIGKFQASEKFLPLLNEVNSLSNSFEEISFKWVKRDQNPRADELSKLGLERENEFVSRTDKHPPLKRVESDRHPTNKLSGVVEQSQDQYLRSPSFKVSSVGNGCLLIKRGNESAVLDILNSICNCTAYREKGSCNHLESVKRLLPVFAKSKTGNHASHHF